MEFDHLLDRASDIPLEEILGSSTVRLLSALDPSLRLPSKLRAIVLGLHGRDGLLASPEFRAILFDLLRVEEARQLALVLGLPGEENAYEALKNVSIRRGSKREEMLYAFFGRRVPVREVVELTPAEQWAAPGYPLFPHQRKAARDAQALLTSGGRRVLLHMPTGAGKTRTSMNIVSEHLRSTEPGLAIWLAYSEELCEQAAQEFERAWEYLGNRPVAVYRFWGNHDVELAACREGILVAGLGKMYNLVGQLGVLGQLGNRCTLVVMDEAHQAVARTYRFVLDALLVHHPKPGLLGLTATPGRTWSDIEEDEKLADFFARQKVTLEVDGYDSPVDYLVEEGYLAKAEFVSLFLENQVQLSEADLARLQQGLDVPEGVLRRLAEDEQRNLGILYRIEELTRRHARVLVFATTVQHSDLLATILQARGIDAQSVTGSTGSIARALAIDGFRAESDEPRVLINYGVLTTGFDAPRTSAVLIARPTKSLVLYSQMVGRGIRGPKAGGNSAAEIVTVVDQHLPGFGSVAEAFTNWEDVWE